jgi:hypothetical protein
VSKINDILLARAARTAHRRGRTGMSMTSVTSDDAGAVNRRERAQKIALFVTR